MNSSVWGPWAKPGQARRRVWRRRLRLAVAVMIAAAALTGCGGSQSRKGDASNADASLSVPAESQDTTSPAPGPREPILIRTRIVRFRGDVLAGSVIGNSPFCPGGTVRHEHGSPEIGFPAVNVFSCSDGQLRIGFGPGPDQMNNAVQTSGWEILDGTGPFAGMSGEGDMTVRFARAGAVKGEETFRGKVAVP